MLFSASAATAQTVPLTAAEFRARAPSLLNKDVEVSGDIRTPSMLGPKSVGTFIDASGKPLLNLIAGRDSRALRFLTGGNDCKTKCAGVFARGKVVIIAGAEPALDVADISFESKVAAAAALQAALGKAVATDSAGLLKPLLPPHGIPTEVGWREWSQRVPRSSPAFDRAASMWDNMKRHSDFKRQAAFDDRRALIRGPERPADFETYYRSIRDTPLSMVFKDHSVRQAGPNVVWPRVAIVIEENPTFTQGSMPKEFFDNTKTETDYCWRMRGKLWMDQTHSVDIAPFNWCFSEMRFNTPFSEIPIWGQAPQTNMILASASTGRNRTTGPVPPATPLPRDPKFRRTFSYYAIMVGSVLVDMGLSTLMQGDGRVWFLDEDPG